MTKAYTGFIEHAKEEEEEQFDKLKAKLTPEENDVRAVVHLSLCLLFSVAYPRLLALLGGCGSG